MAATVPALIAGLILLIPNKGFDLLIGRDSAPPAPVLPPVVSPTSLASSTSATTLTTGPSPMTTAPSAPPAPEVGGPVVGRTTLPRPQPAPGGPAILAQGHETIVNVDGFDLDIGAKGYQDDPGMDISPDRVVTLIYAMSYGKPRMAVLRQAGPPSYASCRNLAPSAYVQVLNNIRSLQVGDHICVLTNQSNYGAITLSEIPSDSAQYLAFDFVAWDTP
jgi:hypothetical protein